MSDKVKILGIALLLLALNSNALTLGRLSGVALVGQPLDLLVQVSLAAEEDASGMCFSADVFYADVLQDASSVRVNVEPAGQNLGLKARIFSSALVNDPVVNVVLHAGCVQKISRRYVLLSDIPNDTSSPLAPQVPLAAAMPLTSDSSEVLKSTIDTKAPPVVAAKSAVHRHFAVIFKPKHVKSVEERKPIQPASAQIPVNLKFMESLSDRMDHLEMGVSTAMTVAPTDDAAQKMQQLKALQSAVKAALDLSIKQDANVLDLKNKLQTAQAQHLPEEWLYARLVKQEL